MRTTALDPSVTFSSALTNGVSPHGISALSAKNSFSEASSLKPQELSPIDLTEGTILKPTLDTPSQRSKRPSTSQLLYQMMERAQQVIYDEDNNPKIDAVKAKIDRLSHEQHALDTRLKQEVEKSMLWERRKNVAQNFLNAAGALLGGTAMVLGSPFTGGALLVGGLGGLASSALDYYGVNPTITGGLSLASGVVSLLGGIASAVYSPRGLFETISSLVQMSTGITTGAMSAYQNTLLSHSAEYQSKGTLLETQQKLLFEKIQGALTGFKGVVDLASKVTKALAKAGKRYSRVVAKMLT